jgi:hypothetical protein
MKPHLENGQPANLVVRLLVALVFLPEGIKRSLSVDAHLAERGP